MTLSEIILSVLESNPNAKTFRVKTRTKPILTKKNRTTKVPTNFTVTVESEFIASLGVNYQNEVNAVRSESGLSSDFVAQKPSGKHYVNGSNYLLESDTEPGRFYIALSRFSDRKTRYLVDGKEADAAQTEDLKTNYLPKPSKNPVLVEWKTYSLDSIISVESV